MISDTYVRARIDNITKARASEALEAMGLSISDEKRLPFDLRVPNAKTKEAIRELEAGKGQSFADLNEDS